MASNGFFKLAFEKTNEQKHSPKIGVAKRNIKQSSHLNQVLPIKAYLNYESLLVRVKKGKEDKKTCERER